MFKHQFMCTLLVKVEKEVKQAKTKLLHFRLPNICTITISLESKSLRNQYPPIPTENVEGNLLGEGGREFPVMEFHDDSSLEFTSQRRLPSPPSGYSPPPALTSFPLSFHFPFYSFPLQSLPSDQCFNFINQKLLTFSNSRLCSITIYNINIRNNKLYTKLHRNRYLLKIKSFLVLKKNTKKNPKININTQIKNENVLFLSAESQTEKTFHPPAVVN